VSVGHLVLDADAVYFTDPYGAPVVTRVPKCKGLAVALPGLEGNQGGPAMSLAVAGGRVGWIMLIGVGGDVATVPTSGGAARLLASTDLPLGDSIALDAEDAYFADGSIERAPLVGGTPKPLVSEWANVGAVDDANVYLVQSPPMGTALVSLPKTGGASSVLVPAIHPFYPVLVQDQDALYWLEWNDQGSGSSVMRVAKGGGAPEVVASGQDAPQFIAVDDTHVYWTVGNLGNASAIMRAAKAGGSPELFAAGPANSGITGDARTLYWSTGHAIMKLDK
jgi:hypothetical protein